MLIKEIFSIVIAYLLGAIPFAYIFTRWIKGIDIRQVGTHNAGAMNTIRQVGLLPGTAVIILDMAKGALSILIAQWLGVPIIFVFLAGFAAIIGHTWPVYLGFRGGRGTATTVGVLFALAPQIFAISFVIIAILLIVTRDTGFAVGVGLALFPLLLWIFGADNSLIFYAIAVALLLLLINFQMVRKDVAHTGGLKNYLLRKRPDNKTGK
jgi:acyl phosphate:glycerol-3-phosphate acyltransferase